MTVSPILACKPRAVVFCRTWSMLVDQYQDTNRLQASILVALKPVASD
jgi:hypothetical protein